MNVLIIGGGGREHTLAWRISQSPDLEDMYCCPGNTGTAALGTNVNLSPDDFKNLIQFAKDKKISLTVVGPEAPLCAGIVDAFEDAGLRIFGPSKSAARIEGDKAFAKQLMRQYAVPTAEARIFTSYHDAREYVITRDHGVVVKASGLAAGKGVIVCRDPSDGLLALDDIMQKRRFGDAGETVIVEEKLKGPELSVLALVSGHTIYTLEAAQDFKRIGEGDTGANTGGMGSYSPVPLADAKLLRQIESQTLVPIVDAMRREGCPYRGVLYAGLMLTAGEPKVLEFNCRFGDPETQAVLMRFRGDLLAVLNAVVDETLEDASIAWDPRSAVCVVAAAEGYPEEYPKGMVIEGLDRLDDADDVMVFHAGTKQIDNWTVTSGGRVLGVTALGDTLDAARARAYEAISQIEFEGVYYRRDIAGASPAK